MDPLELTCPDCGATTRISIHNLRRIERAIMLRHHTIDGLAFDVSAIPSGVDLADDDTSAADIARVVRAAVQPADQPRRDHD